MTQTDLAAVANEAHAWFEGYVETFIELAANGSTDPAPLLDYFSVPISMTTGTAHTVLASAEALTQGLAHELRALRDADYGGSTALDPVVRGLNERAAEIEVTWARQDRQGREFQRVRVLYLTARTDAGWRTVASVILAG
ncbi:DUF6841 family protein [Streptomyces sp. NBC_01431]|uniref:DUF6841 family protein n=1 Tax=Streptomyces sp. NBC_01431 TaxID=2903863 RepID=UPI002E2F2899|nr:hypothetical protein [Streptomyces sp. NBC_01431]